MSGFRTGFACGLRGIADCVRTPALWPWALLPALLTGILFAWLTWGALAAGSSLEAELVGRLPEWMSGFVAGAAGVVAVVALAFVAWFLFAPITRVLAAPFLALLSDRMVARLAGDALPPPSSPAWMRFFVAPVRDALVFLGIRILVTLVLSPLLCLGPIGAILLAALLAPLEGADRTDVALSSRGKTLGERLSFVFRNLGACTGLGVVATLLLYVPFLNVLLLPGLAVGAIHLDRAVSPDFPGGSGRGASGG